MRIAFLIKITITKYTYHEETTYETIDTFIKLKDDEETLESEIMCKYPNLKNINCYDCVAYDEITREKYLIVSKNL